MDNRFKKENSMQSTYTVRKEEYDKIDNILVSLSNGKVDEYLDLHNMHLFDTMLGRYIATLFLNTGESIDNHFGMAVITVKLPERSFKVSVGSVPITKEDNRTVSGIYYDD